MPIPAESSSSGIGSTLRDAREKRGIDLRDIANRTRISMRTLEALERNDISKLPGGIFSRSFVRAYAVEVGLDPEAIVREFISQFPEDTVTAGHPSTPPEDFLSATSERRMSSTLWQIALLSIPVVILVLYFGSRGWGWGDDAPANDVAPAPSAVQPATEPPPPPEPVAAPVATAPAPTGLRVELLATSPCWVSVTVDGRREFAREMKPGERQVLNVTRDVVLTAGNAAALTIALNGEDARAIGRSGQVVTVRITPDTYRRFLANP